jgi:hypothetical protein
MATIDLVNYYKRLLIIQYTTKPKAEGTVAATITPFLMPQVSVQVIDLRGVPTSGSLVLSYSGMPVPAINFDDTASDIQTKFRTIEGLEYVTVKGQPSSGSFAVTFIGVPPVAPLIEIVSTTLDTNAPSIAETDVIIPLAIENAFSLDSTNPAVGKQLDILGKYAGVSRVGQGFSDVVSLNDADYLSLIKMAVILNSAPSDLATIQNAIFGFFNGQMRVYDFQNMRMSYLISSALGSSELVQLFITQGLLPKPMAVQMATVIYAPDINNFFGFCSYANPYPEDVRPFNTYEDFQPWPWLSYDSAIQI